MCIQSVCDLDFPLVEPRLLSGTKILGRFQSGFVCGMNLNATLSVCLLPFVSVHSKTCKCKEWAVELQLTS